jgi:hypothetical protein
MPADERSPSITRARRSRYSFCGRCVMTLDADTKQVAAVGLAYAISILECAPANWLRPGLLFDPHTLLEQLTDDQPNRAESRASAREEAAEGAHTGTSLSFRHELRKPRR